ncbi:MAG: hypothetical protein WKG07_12250 [Hymenobacter sp.]
MVHTAGAQPRTPPSQATRCCKAATCCFNGNWRTLATHACALESVANAGQAGAVWAAADQPDSSNSARKRALSCGRI